MRIGDVCRAKVCMRQESIDDRRFPHTAVSAQQRYFSGQQRFQYLHTELIGRFCTCLYLYALIADCFVEIHHGMLITQFIIGKQVALVEYQCHWNAIGLCTGEETVDEGGGCLGIVHGDNKERLVDVGCDDMALL